MFQGICHMMYYANDMKRAVSWYQEKLNFTVVANFDYHYAIFKMPFAPGIRFDLHPTEAASKDVGFGPILYFKTNDIEKTLEELKSKGVEVGAIRTEGGSHRFASFKDSEGNTLGLEENK